MFRPKLHKTRQGRRGNTLAEMAVSLFLLAMLLVITITLFQVVVVNNQVAKQANQFEDGADEFITSLIRDVKSATGIEVTGNNDVRTLRLLGTDPELSYEINNLRGEAIKIVGTATPERIILVNNFWRCFIDPNDELSFTFTLWFDESNCVQYSINCNSD